MTTIGTRTPTSPRMRPAPRPEAVWRAKMW